MLSRSSPFLLSSAGFLQPAVKAFLSSPPHIQHGRKRTARQGQTGQSDGELKQSALGFVVSLTPGEGLDCGYLCVSVLHCQTAQNNVQHLLLEDQSGGKKNTP